MFKCVCLRDRKVLLSSAVYILQLNVSVMIATSQCRPIYVSKVYTFTYILRACVRVCVEQSARIASSMCGRIVGNRMNERGIRLSLG